MWKRCAVSLLSAATVATVLLPSCGGRTGLPFCGGSTGVSCLPSDRVASKTTCVCTAHVTIGVFPAIIFDKDFNGTIPVCLQPAINSGLIGTLGKTQADIDADPNYANELDARCNQDVDDALERIASLFFGDAACGGTVGISFSHSCHVEKENNQPFVTTNPHVQHGMYPNGLRARSQLLQGRARPKHRRNQPRQMLLQHGQRLQRNECRLMSAADRNA